MLYTLNCSPSRCDLPALLRLVKEGDALLLLQDGVLAGLTGSVHCQALCETPLKLYALQDDLAARGLGHCLSSKITAVSYADFVKLTEQYLTHMAWS